MKAVIGTALGLLLAGTAHAQLVLDPDGTPEAQKSTPQPPSSAPPSNNTGSAGGQPPAGTGGQTMTVPGPNGSNVRIKMLGPDDEKPKEPDGMLLGNGAHATSGPIQGDRYTGQIPDVHVVQRHDTLWDICSYYFGDPWRWPEIWALNPSITNPHWIYPGNLVRLQSGTTASEPVTQQNPPPVVAHEPVRSGAVELRQIAFVSTNDLKVAGTVTGSTEEKDMLSMGDEIYLDYSAGKPPQVGARYSIYAPTKEITHPETKQKIGAFVIVRGEVKILDVKKGKTARGVITYITQQGVVERGDRVGALKTSFKAVTPVAPDKNLEGVIVGVLDTDALIGEQQVVLLDRGKNDGVVVGNTMSIVRRGDARIPINGSISSEGLNDRRYPDRYIADIIVIDIGQTTSVAAVTRSDKEIGIGDHVLMRVSR